jgi:signal transduction histidine kinase/ActR/RegA family two-component response regulator
VVELPDRVRREGRAQLDRAQARALGSDRRADDAEDLTTRVLPEQSPPPADSVIVALRDPASVLVPVVRERARILGPAILACSFAFVVTADRLGVAPDLWAYAVWWAALACHAVLTLGFVFKRIPDRHVQLASSAILWFPALITATGMYSTHLGVYSTLFIVMVASAGSLLHRKLALGTIAALVVIGSALVLRSITQFPAMIIAVLVFAAVGAIPIHFLMVRALVRAEQDRAAADAAAQELQLRIEELQRANEERAALADQLLHSQRMEAVGTLAAGVAHDMNNVLAAINGLGDLLLGELQKPQLREDVEQILAQTERGAVLTRSLLAFSRRGQYRKRPIRLWELVRGVVPILERTLPKSIKIVCELDADICVNADPTHLEQVLVNLALNAKDAMAGSGTLTITGDVDREVARLRVTDTGSGMDEATRTRVFEPFFTTKPMGKGTGLGLSTVWGIVQAHGGTVTVESSLGHGTTFTIKLPRSQAVPTALARATTSQELAPQTLTKQVLLVDDEPAVRATAARQLQRIGVDVITAENGVDALAKFAAHRDRIGVVVLDMGMPQMGGAECFAKLREQSDVAVLIATGYAVDEEAQKLVAQGASLLEKPFSSDQFRREVMRLLERASAVVPPRRPSSDKLAAASAN